MNDPETQRAFAVIQYQRDQHEWSYWWKIECWTAAFKESIMPPKEDTWVSSERRICFWCKLDQFSIVRRERIIGDCGKELKRFIS